MRTRRGWTGVCLVVLAMTVALALDLPELENLHELYFIRGNLGLELRVETTTAPTPMWMCRMSATTSGTPGPTSRKPGSCGTSGRPSTCGG